MDGLSDFENAVLAKLLDGDHPLLAALRLQAEKAKLISRDYTGVGFFCHFLVPPDVAPLSHHRNFHIGDVDAKIAGLKHGAGFVLFVRNGWLETLEGYTYDEPWPDVLDSFELSYRAEPRRPDIPGT